MYATCSLCERQMVPGGGCRESVLIFKPKAKNKPEVQLKRLRFGEEQRFGPVEETGNCHDCNAASGAYHHTGCDWEECPQCGGQLLACACNEKGKFFDQVPAPTFPVSGKVEG